MMQSDNKEVQLVVISWLSSTVRIVISQKTFFQTVLLHSSKCSYQQSFRKQVRNKCLQLQYYAIMHNQKVVMPLVTLEPPYTLTNSMFTMVFFICTTVLAYMWSFFNLRSVKMNPWRLSIGPQLSCTKQVQVYETGMRSKRDHVHPCESNSLYTQAKFLMYIAGMGASFITICLFLFYCC